MDWPVLWSSNLLTCITGQHPGGMPGNPMSFRHSPAASWYSYSPVSPGELGFRQYSNPLHCLLVQWHEMSQGLSGSNGITAVFATTLFPWNETSKTSIAQSHQEGKQQFLKWAFRYKNERSHLYFHFLVPEARKTGPCTVASWEHLPHVQGF